MLIVVTVFPVCTGLLTKVDPDKQDIEAVAAAAVTFCTIILIAIFGPAKWKLWGPLIGVLVGTIVSVPLGLFNTKIIADAAWVGLPTTGWPGLDLSFDSRFWSLFPAFAIVTVVGAIETFGDAISMQRCGHRTTRPIDFRSVQGALRADGIGNLLSGLMGTLPNTTYSTSISLVEFTGVAARRVGIYGGVLLLVLAFFPKVSALLQAVPNPVIGAYLIIMLAVLFSAGGIRLVAHGGLSAENGLLVGISFWMGTAFQNGMIFPKMMPGWLQVLLGNGMTAGGFTALIISGLFYLRRSRSGKLEIPAGEPIVGPMHAFVNEQAREQRWDDGAVRRLELACEEALMFLLAGKNEASQRIRLSLRFQDSDALLEFSLGGSALNVESALSALTDKSASEDELGLRLLRSLAANVEHHEFDDGGFLAMRVESKPL